MKKICLMLVLVLMIALPGWAKYWYAAPSGTNGDGSESSPWVGFSNIVWGSGGVDAGDTLWLMPGTYNEQLKIGTSGSDGAYITIRGDYGANNALIDGQDTVGRLIHLNTNDYLIIKSLNVINSSNYGIASDDSSNPGDTNHIIISNCRIKDCSNYGVQLHGNDLHVYNCVLEDLPNTAVHIIGPGITDIYVEGCIVVNCGTEGSNTDGIFIGNGAGTFYIQGNYVYGQLGGTAIDSSSTSGADPAIGYIRYNMIEDSSTAIKGGDENVSDTFYICYNKIVGGGNQISCNNNGAFHVINNILVNSTSNSLVATGTIGTRTISFYNNICYNPTDRYLRVLSTGLTLNSDHNCFYGSGSATPFYYDSGMNFSTWKSTTNQDSNSFEQDPLLTSTYHLTRNSPCIDAGTQVTSIHDQDDWKDLDGHIIHYGSNPDIGCYEYNTNFIKRWGKAKWNIGRWGRGKWGGARW